MAFHKKLRTSAVLLSTTLAFTLPAGAHAAVYAIGNIDISNVTYRVWNANGVLMTNNGNPISTLTSLGPNTNLVGGYIGSGGASTPYSVPNAVAIGSGLWYGLPFSVYSAAFNLGDTMTPAGTIGGGAVPSGTLDTNTGTINMNLSGLFGNWNNVDFNIGTGKGDGVTSAYATGTWAPNVHAYTLTWTTLTNVAGYGTYTAQFTVSGTATPVPVPAAVWLMLSGLAGLSGLAAKRKTARA